MIKIFEASDHFRTFAAERDPSLSTNCHVLLTLLHQSNPAQYKMQIIKTVKFIIKAWWASDNVVKDKWV